MTPETSFQGPRWFDLQYVTAVMNKYTGDQLQEIKNFCLTPATVKGENYFSVLYSLRVEYTLKTASNHTQLAAFIVKSKLENELMAQLEDDFDIYQREKQYYAVISEEFEKLLNSVNENCFLQPRVNYIDDRVIVMENLKLKGYNIKDVREGLDLNQCHLVIQKLAKFHALSMVLYKKNPDIFRYHLSANISENPSPLHDMYKKAILSTIEYCENSTELKQYVSKLKNFSEQIINKMIGVYSRNLEDRLLVLNHGDLWINNIMFNNAKDNEDVLFIDFQEGFYGSPGIDWNYFIFSSWQLEVFQHHFEDLIMVYQLILSNFLRKFNYQGRIPNEKDIKLEIMSKGSHGLATATCILPILINEHSELTDPEDFITDTEEAINKRRIIFSNPKFGQKLQIFLKYFVENNIL
ncbi:uncharacterized protein LOC119641470 [Glossina fuscipes]|uniref:Uncharacterized protein LOC119641470 n=1 Tax=Glossina fuscipes TaxID=7396 RepID=A0A9C5ZHN5_9MUSC|nr:uncharacterized protein LOC119641470 [Glossina fuscipes]XP_037896111.1 uncharacterized protein LOC119641470 [Glossina fuscipes]